MKLPEEKLARAVESLRGSPHFKTLLEHLSVLEREETARLLGGVDLLSIGRAQGAIAVLQRLQQLPLAAETALQKFDKAPSHITRRIHE